jgi:hypothetical protein
MFKRIKKLFNDDSDDYQLVKSRPQSLSETYVLLEDKDAGDDVFMRLYDKIADVIDSDSSVTILKEYGKSDQNRNYFFVQHLNEKGLLFERNLNGWEVSTAQKIVANDSFIRDRECLDVVTLHKPKEGAGMIRVSSAKFGDELISFVVYEQKIIGDVLGNSTDFSKFSIDR